MKMQTFQSSGREGPASHPLVNGVYGRQDGHEGNEMTMEKLLEIGLSGWLIFIVTILFGGGVIVRHITIRRTRQSNITAGGDVAGGDIIKVKRKNQNRSGDNKNVSNSVQKHINAEGDVAGGNIEKGDK